MKAGDVGSMSQRMPTWTQEHLKKMLMNITRKTILTTQLLAAAAAAAEAAVEAAVKAAAAAAEAAAAAVVAATAAVKVRQSDFL